MEIETMEGNDEDHHRKLLMAIRCAKAGLLLSSLKSSINGVFEAANIDESEEENEKMRKEIENLRLELMKERLKSKKKKILQLTLVILISSLFMKLALDFFVLSDDEFPFCNHRSANYY